MRTTRTQGRGSRWGERNSFDRYGEQGRGYERSNRYNYSNDQDDIGFDDNDDYDDERSRNYERNRDFVDRFHEEDDNDLDYNNFGEGYENDDDYENRRFQNDYEDDNLGYSGGGRRGRKGEYDIMDSDNLREIGRRGNNSSYGGSSYGGSGSRNFSRDYNNNQYRPYGNSRAGRLTNSYGSSNNNNSDYDSSLDNYDNDRDERNEDDSDYYNRY